MRLVLIMIGVFAVFGIAACGSKREEVTPWELKANAAIAERLNAPQRFAAGRASIAHLLRLLPPVSLQILTDSINPEQEIDHSSFAISSADMLDEIVQQASPEARTHLVWEIIGGQVVIGSRKQLADPEVREQLRSEKHR